MKRIGAVLLAALLVLVALSVGAEPAPGWRGSGGWGPAGPYQRNYNLRTTEVIEGTVERVDRVRPMEGMHDGVAILVKTDRAKVIVHLGPAWYIERLDHSIRPKDRVRVYGSLVILDRDLVLIAAQVRVGDEVLHLRDDDGIPAWVGWRHSPRRE